MKTNIDDVGGASNGDGLRLPVTLRAAGAEGADRTSAFVAHLGAAAAGSVLVRNEGGYVARFTLTYSLDGHEFTQESGDITLGVNKSAWIPAGATEIQLKVEENIGWAWSTIFTKSYAVPTTVCFKVWGTTLFPAWAAINCG
jgi:hypothetical protein